MKRFSIATYDFPTLCTLAARVANRPDQPTFCDVHLPALEAYLVLLHQSDCPTSYYVLNCAKKIPLFTAAWLDGILGEFADDSIAEDLAWSWRYKVGWASDSNYVMTVRSTIADHLARPLFSSECLPPVQVETKMNAQFGSSEPTYSQAVFLESGQIQSMEREYPGWMVALVNRRMSSVDRG